ncbi:MAG: tRNA (adenosine(37)-N6)-threonylcarbamoyltransferase complex dimerization subunit type 1 TsaB [Lachnospiraceae bacterium]|nr:tRNA (adenosine(37)-N6)-threonylcarbamoyltransferase complex dimerization subunit type 1 TsaB [Lachnospiraceae bacterium]
MKILGIDSSGLTASVAVVEDDIVIGEYNINFRKTHSQTLLPMLDELSGMISLDAATIDGIAVSEGPGSFTGLRIGSAMVKGLARAWEKPIIPVPTVDALAYNMYGSSDLICPIMDARRNQTYTGLYEFVPEGDGYKMNVLLDRRAVDLGAIMAEVNASGRRTVFLGDGVPVFAEQLREEVRVEYSFAPAFMNRQRAAALAVLAASYMREGRTCTAAEHAPVYLRMSQAERERMESGQ